MKSEKLYEAIGEIDERLVLEAEVFTPKKKKRGIAVIMPLAAVLVLVISLAVMYKAGFFKGIDIFRTDNTPTIPSGVVACPTVPASSDRGKVKPVALSVAEYPEMARYPLLGDLDPTLGKWAEDRRERRGIEVETDNIVSFSNSVMSELLTDKRDENNIISPLNIFMALAMLAETCDGTSRQQILELSGADSIEALREQANRIWNKNYHDDGAMKSIMSSSLWLDDSVKYKASAIKTLTENYYTSVFSGDMGTDVYDKMLNRWISDNTDGLLDPGIKMNSDTVMAIATTLLYATKWESEFSPSKTETGSFYAPDGEKEASFMKASRDMYYFWGEKYAAIALSLNIGGQMWFILPDEGVDADEIFADAQLLELLSDDSIYEDTENSKFITVNMSIPKFDAQSDRNIIEGIKKLGITDVTDSTLSDFSPIAENPEGIFIDEISHGVRVQVDEEGVQAAAYTILRAAGAAAPPDDEVDFVLDRPFGFVITLDNKTPLFAGVINNP